MTHTNFRKRNHTRANAVTGTVWQTCSYCRRKLPRAEFSHLKRISRRGVAWDVQGPRFRTVTQRYSRCRICRRVPDGFMDWTNRYPGMRTPIRFVRQGLPWPPP